MRSKAMPAHSERFAFILNDVMGERPLSPENVDIPTLRGFIEEIETLIKGDVPGASLAESRIRIESGSLKIIAFVAAALAVDFQADLARLDQTGDLDAIQPKRAQVVERWQNRASRSTVLSYAIESSALDQSLRVAGGAPRFHHRAQQSWVRVEKYLAGKVINLGGKSKPNVHLLLDDTGQTVVIAASEAQLADERENQLYKHVLLRIQGEQHLQTNELRELRLLSFQPQATDVDEAALRNLWEKGRQAWKDVASAASWVDNLRGSR